MIRSAGERVRRNVSLFSAHLRSRNQNSEFLLLASCTQGPC